MATEVKAVAGFSAGDEKGEGGGERGGGGGVYSVCAWM